MGAGQVAPRPINWTFYTGEGEPELLTERDGLYDVLRTILSDHSINVISHNAAYESVTTSAHRPDLLPLWFEAYARKRVYCTMIREKLLNLSTHGKLDMSAAGPGGVAVRKISYSLGSLIFDYFGEDRSADKGDDSWRMNYHLLAGRKASEFPHHAARYAKQDAVDHWRLFWAQEKRLAEAPSKGYEWASMATQDLQASAAFSLHLMTCRGFEVDSERKAAVERMLDEELSATKLHELTVDRVELKNGQTVVGTILKGRDGGDQVTVRVSPEQDLTFARYDVFDVRQRILVPGDPARPYKNGAKNPDGTPKMVAATDDRIDTKALKDRVERACKAHGLEVDFTATGETSCTKDVVGRLSAKDPVLAVYQHRQDYQKLRTTDLPRLSGAVIHCPINILVETGRTSSYEAKSKDKRPGAPRAIFPSMNGQNPHPKIRPVFRARQGTAIFSVDYHAIDLVMVAQLQVKLFGSSVLADGFNANVDPHAYLGAQLAYHLDPHYRAAVERSDVSTPMDNWRMFDKLKKVTWLKADGKWLVAKDQEWAREFFRGEFPEAPARGGWKGGNFFKHYRTFAKPTGLGYPGGLGPDTFIDFARSPYGVIVDRDQAVELRDVWRATYPEMPQYLDYINSECVDPTGEGIDEDGKAMTLYRYRSPLGMVRARATYCAAANGLGLQTPEAEGMKLACFALQRACWDPTLGSPLYGRVFPIVMIHDEIVGEVLWEPGTEVATGALLDEVGRIMTTEMRTITPNVRVKTSGCAMKRWYKEPEDAEKAGDLVWKSA